MVSAEDVAWIAPLAGTAMTAAIVWAIVWYLAKRAEYYNKPDQDFRRLAEEAVRGQTAMAHETQKLAESVRQIQELLSKV